MFIYDDSSKEEDNSFEQIQTIYTSYVSLLLGMVLLFLSKIKFILRDTQGKEY
ncbi:uncharacterized protein DS421_12g368400 [Arachis hypogaea]|nr:uncharacterized protein DS421_12g368400 [Arachis hypogaea]